MKHAWRTASGALLLLGAAACSEGGTGDAPSKAASGAFDKDPFPSTYEPYPSNPVLLQNATVYDGIGGVFEKKR